MDDFKVKSVGVTIIDATNKIVEQGEAALFDNHIHWMYTVKKRNRTVEGCTMQAVALDIPGNKGSLEMMISREG